MLVVHVEQNFVEQNIGEQSLHFSIRITFRQMNYKTVFLNFHLLNYFFVHILFVLLCS